MFNIVIESIIIGLICLFIGTVIFNLSINKNNKNNINKPVGINVAFFMTGVMLHLIMEYSGINSWQCTKKSITGFKYLTKLN